MTDTGSKQPRNPSDPPQPRDAAGPSAPASKSWPNFGSSQLFRILLIGFLVLLLQIPLLMIRGVILERSTLRHDAVSEIATSWGGEQEIHAPILIVPYRTRWVEERDERSVVRTAIRYAHFLPETLDISGDLDTQTRYRGIFEVPVYLADLSFKGRFEKLDFDGWAEKPEDILWDRAEVVVAVSDPRGIRNAAQLAWGDQAFDFLPGAGMAAQAQIQSQNQGRAGFHVDLHEAARLTQDGIDFAFRLTLQGNEALRVAPFAKQTSLQLRSDWADPSFQGAWLPTDRQVDASGFEARWEVPFLGRSFPQRWNDAAAIQPAIARSSFGLRLATMVDEYRMAERSAKYGMLFITLTFGTLWLFEVIAGIRVHSIQYLLVGAGLCLFYLLELSLSEHIGFSAAYLIASAAVILLITSYSRVVLGSTKRVASIAAVLVALYGYLFVLLRDQNYALLVGSLGLFGALAAVMYLTRKVDWGGLKVPSQNAPEAVRTP